MKLQTPKWDNNSHYISKKSSPFGPATASSMYGLFYFANVSHNILMNFIGLLSEPLYKKLLEGPIRLV
jgi:hypothetical protein